MTPSRKSFSSKSSSSSRRPEWNNYLTDAERFKLSQEEATRRGLERERSKKKMHKHLKHRSSAVVTPPKKDDASAMIFEESFTARARSALAKADVEPSRQVLDIRVAQLEAQLEDSEDAREALEARVDDMALRLRDLETKLKAETDARRLLLCLRPQEPPPPSTPPPEVTTTPQRGPGQKNTNTNTKKASPRRLW